jgi:hypothetical protein
MHLEHILEKTQLITSYPKMRSSLGTGVDCKKEWRAFRNDGNVLYFDYHGSYTDVYICQNIKYCMWWCILQLSYITINMNFKNLSHL